MYSVKEIFYSIQGEGYWSGKPAVFCRFVGCNLWSGIEKDRTSAECKICDTDFLGGFKVDCKMLIEMIKHSANKCRFVVFTGGEPFLQLDEDLVKSLQNDGFFVAVETNGTVSPRCVPNWITLSPKTSKITLTSADEVKLLWPPLFDYDEIRVDSCKNYLQPVWDKDYDYNLKCAVDFVKNNPDFMLSLQTHKLIGVE